MKLAFSTNAFTRFRLVEAIRARGLTLIQRGRRETVQVRCVATPEEAGQQDIVFLTFAAWAFWIRNTTRKVRMVQM